MRALREYFQSLSERDQRTLRWGGIAAAIIIVFGTLTTLNEKASAAERRIAAQRELVAELPMRLGNVRRVSRLDTDVDLPLLTLVRKVSESSGVSPNIEAGTDGSAKVALNGVGFDATLEILANLEAAGVPIRRLRVDAAGAGRVNVALELASRRS